MVKYHLTPDGPKKCSASKKPCKYSAEEHAENLEEAYRKYELKQESFSSIKTKLPSINGSKIKLSSGAEKVVKALTKMGAKPVIVGGYVRDSILGYDSKDIDIEVYGSKNNGEGYSMNDLMKAFPSRDGFKAETVGVSFAVLKIKVGREDFDVSLPRIEKNTGEHHRDYEIEHDSTMSYEEASSRRDFTINSIGYSPVDGRIIDPHGGVNDCEKRVLRHIGEAFSEDPLRALRAVNFSSRFSMDVAPETQELCREIAPQYSTLARERVVEEFNKLFSKGVDCGKGLSTLKKIGWADQMSGFKNCSVEELQSYGDKLNSIKNSLYRKAVLCRVMEKNSKGSPLSEIEFSNANKSFVKKASVFMDAVESENKGKIVKAHRELKASDSYLKNNDVREMLIAVGQDSSIIDSLPEEPIPPVVTGKKLLESGYSPGPEMGKLISRAQSIQDEESEYSFDVLLSKALKNN